MNTAPPFLVNLYPLFGGRFGPVPDNLWRYFCTRATADAMLADCQSIDAEAKLYDLLNDKVKLPAIAGVGRFPFPFQATDPTSDVSAYLIVGNVPLKTGENALLSEFAGWLEDTKSGAIQDSLDMQAANIQKNQGKSRLFAYVSPFDPADSDSYWADSAVLGGLAL